MEIRFSKLALKQRDLLKKRGNVTAQKKISKLLDEIILSPFSGLGRPEQLKGYEIPTYSRRIDKKNRLIYSLLEEENVVEVLSIWGHYEDK
ncbi:Txe/YoeB family addiction module toxin [Olivibacter sitiensis]|uniref:Txe/YoeB family addiction module toxin n=1 Tax=Olivibacter sitiensis TaxID=376470 RepID=UPI000403023C|nr:Txe/YoeB family addiction module toxin [Olivibacter sitiensis]